ncbi:VOC family protein [Microbacterium pseudoresistens]|uniref:Catechol 2,3-dioxygenase-like lactoylglutathione lyase family enzyme n=1 Tax=Microbacterium pseudoresistens TaxID=640634 RepID=A0A7Y9EXF2_9MICO|nr:VOC family protein [Microbacterium pseudoresistens]NYD55639.1 catechol 2,3-dioxygenase-like lactoylglutathione lyase family enzyme [Microbacterium pseudoresistens]
MSTQTLVNHPTLLDHVVIAGPDLEEVVSWFAERTGVTATPGGAHPTGTANALVALTVGGERRPHYMELIGPNPEVEHETAPQAFGIDGLDAPTIVTYAIHPEDIEAALAAVRAQGLDPGDIRDLSRRRPDGVLLEWRLTRSGTAGYRTPFLIDWGRTEQPGLSDIATIELVAFERVEPDPGDAAARLRALPEGGAAPTVQGDPAGFRLTLRTPSGETVVL